MSCKLTSPPDSADNDPMEDNLDTVSNTLNEEITQEEILCAIGRLRTGKAASPDEILGEMLKSSVDILLPYLTKFFNMIFTSSSFPSSWRRSTIVAIHKNGSFDNPDNYRGISLLSILSKVFTSILNSRLVRWAEEHNHFVEQQAGFRKNYSTTDNIFILHSLIERYLIRKKKNVCIFH